MSAEQREAAIRRFVDQALNRGDLSVVDEVASQEFVGHHYAETPELPLGPEGARRFVYTMRAVFPDLHVTVHDMLDCGDRVITRWELRGTQRGQIMGLPATGRPVVVTGITIDRFVGNRVVEEWVEWDRLGMLRQMGVTPSRVDEEAA